MSGDVIRIAAAVLLDGSGRMLLVRKRGTAWFMQPGGKIASGETPQEALLRELDEELGLRLSGDVLSPLGRFAARAANEPGCTVQAELFAAPVGAEVAPRAEIEAIAWVTGAEDAGRLPLAELTARIVLPLFGAYRSRLTTETAR